MPNHHFIAKLVPGGGPDPAAELRHIVEQTGDAPDGTAWFATRVGQGWSLAPDSLCILFHVDRTSGGIEALAARLRRRQGLMPDDPAVQELHRGQGSFPFWWQVANPRLLRLPSLEAIPGRSGEGKRASETFKGQTTFAYWFFHDLAGDGDLFTRLVNCLQPGESVETATAPRAAEAAGSRAPNRAAEVNAVEAGIDAVRLPAASRPTPKGEKSPGGLVLRPALPGALTAEPTLCLGLDFAWWGGGPDARSQTDTLFFATVQGDQAGPLQMRRVLLRSAYDPNAADGAANCDPDAALVLAAAEEVIAQHGGTGRVVMAVDAPLRALDRPHLPPRNRMVAQGMEYRQCERAAREGQQQDAGSGAWKHVWNIQPGAPLCPRVAALVAGLQRQNFELYTTPTAPVGRRVLFECFPGEALWALGARGHFDDCQPGDAKEYKTERWADPRLWGRPAEGAWRAWPEVVGWVYRGVYGFGAPEVVGPQAGFHRWMTDLAGHVLADGLIMDKAGRRARRGKPLDDLVESLNCFLTAVAFVRGRAHVWLGDDPGDGHIIGPGL